MDLVPGIVDMELTGIAIDQKALSSLDNEFHFDLAKLQLELSEAAGFEINMNAGRQKAELIYDILEIPCPKCGKRVSKTPDLDLHPSGDGPDNCNIYTKSGERTTAANTLEEMDDPLIEKMLDYAKLAKLTQAFTTGITEKLNEGRIHADFDQSGARSGRFSCRNPNLQQIPSRSERGKRVRELFVASPGNVLIVSDLSQIELRMLAHYTQDKGLLSCYHQNLDLHAQTAAIAYGEKFTPIDRTYAKNVNFSIVYGAGARTITRKYHLPNQRVAEKLLAAFYDAYPRVQPWKEEIWDEACRRFRKGRVPPYVTTILGRKRRLPALLWGGTKEKNRLRSAAERQAISVTISGSAADLFKTIVIDANNVFEDFGWGHCLMLVHDEIVAEVPEKYAEDGLIVIKEVMENVRNPFTDEKFLSVPIVADTHLVTRWSDAK
jgi:DNA polymerase-1